MTILWNGVGHLLETPRKIELNTEYELGNVVPSNNRIDAIRQRYDVALFNKIMFATF